MKKGIRILIIILAVIAVLAVAATITFKKLEKKSEALFADLVEAGAPYVELSSVPDGTYKGSYSVFPVDVEVEVNVAGGEITDIEILKHVNGQGGPAEAIIEDVIEEQTLQVDTVSGATYSSLVILKAVEDALR